MKQAVLNKLKRAQIFLLAAFMIGSMCLVAQPQYSYDPGTGYIGNSIPFNSTTNRRQVLYMPSDFTNAQPGLITKIYFKASAAASPSYQNLEIKMGTTALTALTAGPFITTNMVTVFSAATFSTTSLTGNWVEVTLQTPFLYNNTSNFIVDVTQGGYSPGFTGNYISVNDRSIYGAAGATSASAQARLGVFGFDVVPAGPCTSPPQVGSTTANLTQVCVNNSVNLGVDSLSYGQGQSYQWQYSTDNITWVNMVNDTLTTATAVVPSSRWFRCQVTCGASTSTSTPIQITAIGSALPAGTYTINGGLATGGANFNSFSDFAQAIVCGGIAGPIVVNVISKGSAYNEQIQFGLIGGASATNTITINGNGETLTYGGGSPYATILFNGAKYFKIKNLKVEGTGTSLCFGVNITGGSDYIEFDSCQVSITQSAASTSTGAFIVSGSTTATTTAGASGQHITIKNSIIEGGYYCLTMTGPNSSPYNTGNVVENNIIRDYYVYGSYFSYQDGLVIKNNDIHRENRMGTISTFYGIYYTGNATGLEITGNRMHNSATQNTLASYTAYPIYMSVANASISSPAIIANNAIYNIEGVGTRYAMYIASGDNHKIYHNTVSVDNSFSTGTGTIRAFFLAASSGTFDIKNNLFNVTEGGTGTKHCIYISSATPAHTIDNNQYNMGSTAGTNYLGYFGSNQTTFADWQSVNSGAFDQNGAYGDPIFDPTAYKPQSSVGNNGGANLLAIVPTDIFGVARTSTPDMGAAEYSPLSCLQPNIMGGTSTSTAITIDWTNDPDADSVHIEYGVSGFVQGTGTMMFASGTTATATGLNPQTCYDFYVTTYCNGSIGNGYAFYTYCTKCAAQPTPYTENFDGITASNSSVNPGLPDCWFYWESPGHTGYGYTYTSLSPNSAPNHMRFYSGSSLVDTLCIISPAIQGLTAGNKQISFWAKSGSTVYDQRVIIGTTSSPDQMNTLVIMDTVVVNATYAEYTVFLDAGSGYNGTDEYVVIMHAAINGTGQSMYLDDILINSIPSCNPPTTITANTIGSTTAQIAWTTVQGTCFDIEYGPQGFVQGTGNGTLVKNVSTPYNITSLSPNTFYDVYVRDCCDTTVWAGPFNFKTNCTSQLNGTYTVGGTAGPTNFATLDSAISVLTGCGISGAVTFNLQGGVHNLGPVEFMSIAGASATNTITFNGGGVAVDTITFSGGSAGGFTFNGSSFINFQNLTIDAPLANRQVWMWNGAHHITFNNCHLLGSPTATSSVTCVIAISSSSTSVTGYGDNANFITVTNCKLVGGYYGFVANGTNTSSYSEGFTLTNNEFVDQYYYGMRFYYIKDVDLEGNIAILNRNTNCYGLYAPYTSNLNMKGNQFFGNTYGAYLTQFNVNQAPTTNNEFSNNFFGGSSNSYGIYLSTYKQVNIWHNSFRGNTSGFYAFTPTDVDIRNNIFVSNTSYAFYNSTNQTSGFVLDYNIYHTGGASIAYNGAAFATLAAWQTAQSSFNANSIVGDPGYVSVHNHHILSTLPNDVGVNGLATIDIDGQIRPATGSTTVDIGADEYTPLQWDAQLDDILVPLAGCGDSTLEVHAIVTNLGLNTIASLPITVMVSGGATATLSFTNTTPILQGATDTILVGSVNTALGATGVNFMGYTALAADQDNSNDTVTVGPGEYFPLIPQYYMPDTLCANADSATFAALNISGVEYGWFANATDTVAAVENDSITFALSGQQTWYLGYLGSGEQTLVTAYLGGNGCSGGAMFNITANKTLSITGFEVSTTLGVGTAVPLTVYYIPNGTYLGNETSASAWTTHSSTTATSAGNGQATIETLPMPLIIPAGTTYAIFLNYAASYTNGNGTNQTVSNADMTLSLGVGMCGLFTGPNNPRVFNGGVIYGGEACSNVKVPVTLPLITDTAMAAYNFTVQTNGADVNFDATASNGDAYGWDFGDGSVGTGVTTSHTYAQAGTYTVCLGVYDSTCASVDTICQTVLATVGIEEGLIAQTMNVYPNPNNGKFRVEFQVEGLKNVEVRVLSILGEVLYSNKPGNVSGTYREDIDLSDKASGVYILQISTENGTINRKVTVRK